jgi:hypothetical protein
MKPNGRRAWRKAAKKLRRTMGRRWRSQEEWVYGKRWSELVPDLEAHRAHVTGAWFRRHGLTELDPRYQIRQYIGLWGTADGDEVEFVVKSRSFTARSLVGMPQGARKRAAWYEALRTSYDGDGGPISNRKLRLCVSVLTAEVLAVTVPIEWRLEVRAKYRIGERLRPCPGCFHCQPGVKGWHIDRSRSGRFNMPALALHCDGIGVLPARKQK